MFQWLGLGSSTAGAWEETEIPLALKEGQKMGGPGDGGPGQKQRTFNFIHNFDKNRFEANIRVLGF